MRHLVPFFAMAVLALLPSSLQAAPLTIQPTYIVRVAVDKGGLVYVKVDQSVPAAGTGAAACSTNGAWQIVFSATTPAGQAMLSAALSAKMARSPVRIIGTGDCGLHPSIESADLIDILP